MKNDPRSLSRQRLIQLGLLAWLATLGVDFFLHGGLLARFYTRPSPFLLPPLAAFQRIPAAYLAFLLLLIPLVWLQIRLQITDARTGFLFGLRFGLIVWGALALGLWSIATADWDLLLGWWLGQASELAVVGAVVGHGLYSPSLRPLVVRVVLLVFVLLLLTVILQSSGWAPAVQIAN